MGIRKEIEAFMKALGAKASEIQVYMALSKKKSYTSVRVLEEELNLSSKSIRNALKSLERKGWVRSKRRGRGYVYKAVPAKEIFEDWRKNVEKTLQDLLGRFNP